MPKSNFFENHAELLVAVFCYCVAILLVHPWGNFPLNDDWCYAAAAQHLANTGQFEIVPLQAAWGLPQILIGALLIKIFGFSHLILRLIGILSSIGSAVILSFYFKSEVFSSGVRFLALVAFLFFPPIFMNSLSFMSDTPFLFLWLWSCWCWSKAFRNPCAASIGFASGVTLLCLAQRQFGVILSVLVLCSWFFIELVQLVESKRRGQAIDRKRVFRTSLFVILGVSVQFVAYVVISKLVTKSLKGPPMIQVLPFQLSNLFDDNSFEALSYIGLAVVPFVFKTEKKVWLLILAAVLSFFAVQTTRELTSSGHLMPYFGNQISQFGMFKISEVLGGRMPALFSPRELYWITMLSSFGVVVLILRLAKWISVTRLIETFAKPSGFLILSGIAYFSGLSLFLGFPFDRYLLPCFAVGLVLVLSGSTREEHETVNPGHLIGLGLVALFVATSLLIGDYYMRWNETKWRAAEWLVHQGVQSQEIDGGYEWRNWWKYSDEGASVGSSGAYKASISFESHAQASRDPQVLEEFTFTSWIADGNIVVKKD